MNAEGKEKNENLEKRADAFDKMNRKIEDKKVKDLERSIEYLNFFLSRKIEAIKTEK